MKKTSFRKLLAMPSYSIKSVFMEYLKLLKLPYYDECCSNNNGYPVRYNEGNIERFDGTDWQVVPTGSSTIALSSITPAISNNVINSTSFYQNWQWNSIQSGREYYGLMLSTTVNNSAPLRIEGYSNSWGANLLRILDNNAGAGSGNEHSIIQTMSPSLPAGSRQNSLIFGVGLSSNDSGFISFVNTGTGLNTNRIGMSLYGTSDILTVAGTNRVGICQATAPTAPLDINGNTIRLRTAKTPASASDTGNQGDIAWDTDYMYVCVATNTWKRTPLSTW